MSSAEAQVVYNRGSFSEPKEAQEGFAQQFDLSQPDKAMDMYQRIMHQHTKQQFEMASQSSGRRSTRTSDTPSFGSENSTGSVNSTASS